MTILTATLDALRDGPRSKPEIETYLAEVGYAPISASRALWQLKRAGQIRHVQRAHRHRSSLYALEAQP